MRWKREGRAVERAASAAAPDDCNELRRDWSRRVCSIRKMGLHCGRAGPSATTAAQSAANRGSPVSRDLRTCGAQRGSRFDHRGRRNRCALIDAIETCRAQSSLGLGRDGSFQDSSGDIFIDFSTANREQGAQKGFMTKDAAQRSVEPLVPRTGAGDREAVINAMVAAER